MKPIVPILGVLSALWLILGTWWVSSIVCGSGSEAGFSVVDDQFKASSEDMFTFALSSDKATYTKNTETAFKEIATYLNDHPERQLQLTGVFDSRETNNTAYDNLGIARAETIKSVLIQQGANGDAIQTRAAESNNLYFDKDKKLMGGVNFLFAKANDNSTSSNNELTNPDAKVETPTQTPALSLDEPLMLHITNSRFNLDEFDGVQDYLANLKNNVRENPNAKVVVTGYNDDDRMATRVSRKMRSALYNLGFKKGVIERYTGKSADSPSGDAGVSIRLK